MPVHAHARCSSAGPFIPSWPPLSTRGRCDLGLPSARARTCRTPPEPRTKRPCLCLVIARVNHRRHRSVTTEHGTCSDPGQTGTPVPSSPMSRRELAVASHHERERTIGLAKPTCGTTAALPRALAAGGHVMNRPCRAPCSCMPPEAVVLATILASPARAKSPWTSRRWTPRAQSCTTK